jgi:hypothetical protein
VIVTPLQAQAFVRRVESLAEDVGRLRRRLRDDEYGSFIVDRVAGHVEAIDSFFRPTAAEFYFANFAISGDAKLSAEEALGDVDERARRLRALLKEKAR